MGIQMSSKAAVFFCAEDGGWASRIITWISDPQSDVPVLQFRTEITGAVTNGPHVTPLMFVLLHALAVFQHTDMIWFECSLAVVSTLVMNSEFFFLTSRNGGWGGESPKRHLQWITHPCAVGCAVCINPVLTCRCMDFVFSGQIR